MQIIPDDAIVVRGGRNRPEDIQRATGTHPSGVTGISVECEVRIVTSRISSDHSTRAGRC
ncbi:hypothetical protein [Phormidesmis priestleyi]|uniref:hypothetical protein n=1 Tax=Phormidesmis priestleyi TaxID=268141 RepID=UPI000AFD41AF|nr:hypothetical protein [Phormidesmis priestleyi]